MRIVTLAIAWVAASGLVWADSCQEVLEAVEAPQRLKTRGKPKRARWEKVDEVLADVSRQLESRECEFTFRQLFDVREKDQVLFPITNSVLRLSPDGVFEGLTIFMPEGDALGDFAGRFRYERSGGLQVGKSYSLTIFQYRGADGQLHSSGHDLLLDRFLVRWSEIEGRTAFKASDTEVSQ